MILLIAVFFLPQLHLAHKAPRMQTSKLLLQIFFKREISSNSALLIIKNKMNIGINHGFHGDQTFDEHKAERRVFNHALKMGFAV